MFELSDKNVKVAVIIMLHEVNTLEIKWKMLEKVFSTE